MSSIYASSEFVGYSLWLVPDEAASKKFCHAIEECAKELGTPTFKPHATLIGGVVGLSTDEVIEKTCLLAEKISVMNAEVKEVSMKDLLYYQCVFAHLHSSKEIVDANLLARQVFSRPDDPEYMPHVSLIYGDLATEVRHEQKMGLAPKFNNLKFQLTKLQAWNTSGPVENWQLLQEFHLT